MHAQSEQNRQNKENSKRHQNQGKHQEQEQNMARRQPQEQRMDRHQQQGQSTGRYQQEQSMDRHQREEQSMDRHQQQRPNLREVKNLKEAGNRANLQVDADKESGHWMVHPTARSQTDTANWVVECESKNEANNLRNDLMNGKAKPPTEDRQHYSTPRRHSDGKTLIYYYPKAS